MFLPLDFHILPYMIFCFLGSLFCIWVSPWCLLCWFLFGFFFCMLLVDFWSSPLTIWKWSRFSFWNKWFLCGLFYHNKNIGEMGSAFLGVMGICTTSIFSLFSFFFWNAWWGSYTILPLQELPWSLLLLLGPPRWRFGPSFGHLAFFGVVPYWFFLSWFFL